MDGPEPTLVVNRGPVACWLAPTDRLSTSSDRIAILDPGAALVVNGDWWGITSDGSAGNLVNCIPGGTAQSFTPASIAAAIQAA